MPGRVKGQRNFRRAFARMRGKLKGAMSAMGPKECLVNFGLRIKDRELAERIASKQGWRQRSGWEWFEKRPAEGAGYSGDLPGREFHVTHSLFNPNTNKTIDVKLFTAIDPSKKPRLVERMVRYQPRSLAVQATVPMSMELGAAVKVVGSFLKSIDPKLAVAAEKCRYLHSGFR